MPRRWPIVFQPLEEELKPVLPYLKGVILNAGCGDRDITQFVLDHGAHRLDHCDLQSSLAGALQCDLKQIPKPEAAYDTILCNAVLEHLAEPDLVLKELHRLLKRGGHLILSVPFLQPYHEAPRDYQRYTRDGLARLVEKTGFEVVRTFSLHSAAQTISWIVWEILREKKAGWAQWLLWWPLHLWNLFSQKTDFALIKNSNAFQIVAKK